jgi:hypothetical protein
MASNGITDLGKYDFVSGGMYPGSQIDHSTYANPTQMPLGAQAVQADYDPETNPLTGEPVSRFAKGGDVSDDDVNFSGMARSMDQKYDPRYMPLRLDDRPMTPVQAAMMRLQAEKQLGEGSARAGISGLIGAMPGRHGVSTLPGAYDAGYNIPVGPGNLDISAYRAMKAMPSGQVPYGANARYSIPFAKGGIASIPRYDGEDDSQVQDTEPTKPPTMAELAEQLKLAYRTNTNYDDLYKQFAATKEQDPTQWYKHQLDFLGQQQGWQIGQNRSDRLSQLEPQINSAIEQAKAAGLDDKEIKSILGSSSNEGRNANVQRIATLSETGGSGFNFQKDLQPGLVALALATAAAATAQPELLGLGETATAAVPLSEITGSTFAGPAFALPEAAATTAGGITALGADAGGATIGAEGGGATIDAGTQAAINSAAAPTYSSTTLPYGITSVAPELSSTLIPGAAALEAGAGATTGGMTAKEALSAYTALNMLKSSLGGNQAATSGQGGPSTTTTTTPHTTTTPAMFNMPTTLGSAYTPYTYAYNPRDFGIRAFAQGGPAFETGGIASLGSYSDGGQLLKGPGDGMSDDIPANIGQDQPARLADGEFVIPADVVSHLGNGSTDAGAKHLYKMMDRIRQARTGNHKQGKRINPEKFLPKG